MSTSSLKTIRIAVPLRHHFAVSLRIEDIGNPDNKRTQALWEWLSEHVERGDILDEDEKLVSRDRLYDYLDHIEDEFADDIKEHFVGDIKNAFTKAEPGADEFDIPNDDDPLCVDDDCVLKAERIVTRSGISQPFCEEHALDQACEQPCQVRFIETTT